MAKGSGVWPLPTACGSDLACKAARGLLWTAGTHGQLEHFLVTHGEQPLSPGLQPHSLGCSAVRLEQLMHLLPARLLLWAAGAHGEHPLYLGLQPQSLGFSARPKDAPSACASPPADCWDAWPSWALLAMHGEHPLSLGLQPWSLCCPAARLVVAKRTGLDIGPAADARLPGGGQCRRQPGGHRGDRS